MSNGIHFWKLRIAGWIVAALVILPSGARAASPCTQIMRDVLSDLSFSEKDLLKDFSVKGLLPGGVDALSPMGVFKVRHRNGHHYVVRLTSETSEPKFEVFANAFIRKAPGASAPRVKRLGGDESAALRARLKQEAPIEFQAFMDDQGPGTRFSGDLTITSFLPIESGEKTLAELNVSNPLRDLLEEISQLSKLGPSRTEYYRKRMRREWGRISKSQKEALVRDLRTLLPAKSRFFPDHRMIDFLVDEVNSLPGSRLSELMVLGLERLPPELKARLADQWALYTALGIPDFHPGNWLQHGGRVLSIDHAWSSDAFRSGASDLNWSANHPFGHYSSSIDMRQFLRDHVSGEMRAYLKGLTREGIQAIAEGAAFKPSQVEVNGILGRIQNLVRAGN